MPNQTFFRLPEEKRRRLIDAAWQEFMAVRFDEASINRIIRGAGISRGSFYQYFADKEDLFFYMLGTLKDESLALLGGAMDEAAGDPFDATLVLFDRLFGADGRIRPAMARVLTVLHLNHTMDVSQLLINRIYADREMMEIAERVNLAGLRQRDRSFLCDVSTLLVFSFAFALRNVLAGAPSAEERERLVGRIDLLRRGSEAVPVPVGRTG